MQEFMMNLILQLPPETESLLKEQLTLSGKSPEDFALEALQEKLAGSTESDEMLPATSRLDEYRQWLSSHPASSAESLDDSRDSIYEGNGDPKAIAGR
jgi:hypothetical protein